MCGLVGLYHFGAQAPPVDEGMLERMRDTMVHRGPDGAGAWVSGDGRVGLGHRRLAIVDLSPDAGQPMANEDGAVQIVFNGEIYNHGELRSELSALGHRFRTDHADTEVIVHGYEAWGIDVVHRLRGMFAFGLWDARTRRIWLARDRIGIKPLYYAVRDGRLRFASEIKAVLADPDVPRALDEEAFYHYLTFLTTPAPTTLFAGIRKLPGGCHACIDVDGSVEVRRYWDVWDETRDLRGASGDEISRLLLDELRQSVRLRKMSDVPVGVFLSGGIDSSTNALLFAEGATEPVRTFCIGFEQDYPSYRNEFEFARLVAERIGARHRERRLTPDDAISAMPLIARHQDEPLADPVCVPVYYVSQLARDNGVTVCQVGEGSDELFIGYPQWLHALRLQRMSDLPVPRPLRRLALGGLRAWGKARTPQYEWARRSSRGEPVFWGGAESLPEETKRAFLGADLRRRLNGLTSYEAIRPIRERFLQGAPDPGDPVAWMSYVDLNFRLPELLLMRVDKMSMAVSLECRVPFLDHRFVGLAMSVPSVRKVPRGAPKEVLKQTVRGVIPDAVIDRPKQGFGVPVGDWLLQGLGGPIREEVRWFAQQTGLLDTSAVTRFLDGPPDGNVWTLYNVASWWRSYFA